MKHLPHCPIKSLTGINEVSRSSAFLLAGSTVSAHALLSPQQTCSPGTYGVNLGVGPRRLVEPSGQLAAVKELAFLGLDGAKFGAGVAADCTIGVCSN
jgi:hypothetical protein